jgi:protein-tyrosine phosphatase
MAAAKLEKLAGYIIGNMLGNTLNQINGWLAGHYGSRRGFVRTCLYRIRYLTGSYRSYRQVDWVSVERLVFVCKGNICRSAYAEAVARSLGIDSISCGIETRTGLPANEDAIRTAATEGFDLSEHKTTPIESVALRDSDLFVAMEPWQLEYLSRKFGEKYRCSLLGLWGRPVKPYIEDPYGASSVYFNNCFNYIEKSVHEVARKISTSGKY